MLASGFSLFLLVLGQMNLGVIWPVWEASVLTDVGCCVWGVGSGCVQFAECCIEVTRIWHCLSHLLGGFFWVMCAFWNFMRGNNCDVASVLGLSL